MKLTLWQFYCSFPYEVRIELGLGAADLDNRLGRRCAIKSVTPKISDPRYLVAVEATNILAA